MGATIHPLPGEGEHRHGRRLPLHPRQPVTRGRYLTGVSGEVRQGYEGDRGRGTAGHRALAALVVLAACGTRLPDEAFEAEGERRHRRRRARPAPTAPRTPARSTGTTDDRRWPATTGGRRRGGGTGGGDRRHRGGDGGGGARRRAAPTRRPTSASPPTTITIGNITAENGVLGDAFAPAARGLRAWAAAHQRQGRHPRPHRSCSRPATTARTATSTLECAQRLVEQDKVFALVATNTRAHGRRRAVPERPGHPGARHPDHQQLLPLPALLVASTAAGYARDGKTVGNNGNLMSADRASTAGSRRTCRRQQGGGVHLRHRRVEAGRRRHSPRASSSRASRCSRTPCRSRRRASTRPSPTCSATARRSSSTPWTTAPTASCATPWPAASSRSTAKVSTVVVDGRHGRHRLQRHLPQLVFIPGDSHPVHATQRARGAEFRDAFARYQPGKPSSTSGRSRRGLQGQLRRRGASTKMGPRPPARASRSYLQRPRRTTPAGGVLTGLDYKPRRLRREADGRGLLHASPAGRTARAAGCRPPQKFPFCYPDAKLYSTPALEQGN